MTPLLSSLGGHGSVVQVDLVAEYDKREVVWVTRAGLHVDISQVSGLRFTPHLDEKLVPPTVQRFEGVGCRHVVGEDAAVGAAVESDTKGLESLLTD